MITESPAHQIKGLGDLEYTFNDYNVLTSYLKQAESQSNESFLFSRIKVGKSGGLAYILFPLQHNASERLPSDANINSMVQFDKVRGYMCEVESYVSACKDLAKKHKFDIVNFSNDYVFQDGEKKSSFLSLGIGSAHIHTIARFSEFLGMIDSTHKSISELYGAVHDSRIGITSSQ